jgi:hypothetical protein
VQLERNYYNWKWIWGISIYITIMLLYFSEKMVKNDQYFYCVRFYYFMLSDALYISLHFLYMKAIELQDLFSFDCGLGDTSKRTGLCIVIQGVKTIFYTDLHTWINEQNVLQWLLTVLSLRNKGHFSFLIWLLLRGHIKEDRTVHCHPACEEYLLCRFVYLNKWTKHSSMTIDSLSLRNKGHFLNNFSTRNV